MSRELVGRIREFVKQRERIELATQLIEPRRMASAAAGAWGERRCCTAYTQRHTHRHSVVHAADADFVNICWWLGRPGGGLYHSVVMVAPVPGSV